jgi:O-antigen/teichoic acid export membrane protein
MEQEPTERDQEFEPAPVTRPSPSEDRTRSVTILKNASIITFGAIALKLFNFLYNIAVVRQLGDAGYGQFAIVVNFVGLFAIFAELGISQFVMREIARHPEKSNPLFWNLVILRLGLALAGIVGITLAAVAFGYPPELVTGVALYTLTFVWAALQAPVEALLTANEKFEYVTSMSVLGQITTMTLGAVVLFNDWGFQALIGVGLLAMIPSTLLGVWAVRRHRLVQRPITITPRTWPQLIRGGLPFGFITLSLTISYTVDSVMLSRVAAPQVVGWYNAAYHLSQSMLFFFDGVTTAMVPTLAKAYLTNVVLVQAWFFRSVKVILLLGLPIAAGGSLVALPLITFLYGEQYLPAVLAFQIIVWDVPLLLFTSFSGNMTTIVGEERAAARIFFIAAISNIILNLLLIPQFSLYGAAVATLVTDLVAAIQFYFVLGRRLELPNMTSIALRIVAATSIMGAAVFVIVDMGLSFLLAIAVGGLTYAGMVVAMRILDEQEWNLLRRLVQKVGRVAA